jgi:hypothetical protein
MPKLRHSKNFRGVPNVQPGMPVLRGTANPTAGRHESTTCGMPHPAPGRAPSVGEAWPPRSGAARIGVWPALYWSGSEVGVRCPDYDETPLSAEEIEILIRIQNFQVLAALRVV